MIPGHHQHPQQQQQQFPLMPPSAFGPGQGNLNLPHPGMEQQPQFSQRLPHGGGITGPVQYQDPAIMSLSKMPPPQAQFPPQYQQQQFPAQSRPAFSSPATVPGMKTLADIEAEMMFGPPRPQGPPQGGQQPQPLDRGGHVGHINPALHNLNYPGMRDRQQQPPPSQQQQRQQQQQQQQPFHQHQQFRHSPGLTNQQQLQQGLQQQVKLNQQQQQHRGPRGPQFE